MARKQKKLGALFAITSAIFYGIWKFGIGQGKGNISTNAIILISTSSAVFIYLTWGIASHDLIIDAKDVIPGLLGGACNYAGSILLLKAFEKCKMGVVTGIGSTSCLVPLLYSIAIGEHLSTRDLLGFSLFFVGLMLFFAPNDQPGHGQKISTAAVSYSFLAALFYGIGIIVLDYGTHESLTGTLLMSMLPQMLLAGVGLERRKSHWNGLSFKSFSILILSGSALAIASMAFYAAANDGDIDIGVASVIRSLNPIVIAFLARLILHEKMNQAEVFALGIVLLGTTFVLS